MLNDRRVIAIVVVGLVAMAGVNVWIFWRPASPASVQAPSVADKRPAAAVGSAAFPFEGQMLAVLPAGAGLPTGQEPARKDDPFRVEPGNPQVTPVTYEATLKVEAVLAGGARNVAVINGETVTVGDMVNGLRVIEIALDHVVLGEGKTRRVLPVE